MEGPFYGALAASASVFVAILTALLVNNYVQIKGDRRQVLQRLSRVTGEIEKLEDQRDKYQETVDSIRSQREQERRESAEKTVDEFIEEFDWEDIQEPVENLSLEDIYETLLEFSDEDDFEELEGDGEESHHFDILKEKQNTIFEKIAARFAREHAEEHRGKGWESEVDHSESYEDEFDEETAEFLESIGPGEPLSFEDFVNKYRKKHDLDRLSKITSDELQKQYDEVVDNIKDFSERFDNSLSGTFGKTLNEAKNQMGGELDEDIFAHPDRGSTIDLEGMLGEDELEQSKEKLIEIKLEIRSMKREQNELQQQKERLNPEELNDALSANILTIIFSVVFPMVAYMSIVVGFSFGIEQAPDYLDVCIVFLSWLLGLITVFDTISSEINDRNPVIYPKFQSWLPMI
ncbi:hypothetical protein [Haloarchaeobius sp. DYHT-AS-18]|uniref:hypothetical protein n=1 Tax=Haloarchaeobius sp. DYHT-AS-18 TaxID=3446117 RepID=UPI003EBF1D51